MFNRFSLQKPKRIKKLVFTPQNKKKTENPKAKSEITFKQFHI